MTDVETIAKSLTKAQRDVVLAIRPGEERRAIDFKGSVAQRLRWGTGKRPPLVTVQITGAGTVAWYRLNHVGCEVRTHLSESQS